MIIQIQLDTLEFILTSFPILHKDLFTAAKSVQCPTGTVNIWVDSKQGRRAVKGIFLALLKGDRQSIRIYIREGPSCGCRIGVSVKAPAIPRRTITTIYR